MKVFARLLEYGNTIKESIKNLLFSKRNKILIVGLLFQHYSPKPLLSGTGVNKDITGAQKSCTVIIGDSLF